jgi:hypothetical protein
VNFGGAFWSLPLKIALDQTFFASYLNAAYCAFIELLQRRPPREIGRKVLRHCLASAQHPTLLPRHSSVLSPPVACQVRSSWWPSLKASWRFWPIAHAFTYSVVPLHLRVLWVDVLEVVWVAILSMCIARSEPDECVLVDET